MVGTLTQLTIADVARLVNTLHSIRDQLEDTEGKEVDGEGDKLPPT